MATKGPYRPVESSGEVVTSARDRRKLRHRFSGWIEDTWLLEITSAVLGLLFIVALYIVLQEFDGKPAPQFGHTFGGSLTLNTIVAILGTVAKALLYFPIAECLGQLKWVWFSKDFHLLNEFASFDRASRSGIWGGLELLRVTRLRSFALVAALLAILAIAIDPLSQQLIAYRTESVPSTTGTNATIPISAVFDEVGTNDHAFTKLGPDLKALQALNVDPSLYGYISTGMKGAIQFGLFGGVDNLTDIAANCPGGNCTFDPYPSLAVCSSITDVTSHLYTKNVSTNDSNSPYDYQWHLTPYHYVGSEGFMNISSVAVDFQQTDDSSNFAPYLNFSNSIAYQSAASPIADVFIIVSNGTRVDNGWSHTTFIAYEIALEWCVQNFVSHRIFTPYGDWMLANNSQSTAVASGNSSTQRLSSTTNFNATPGYYIQSDMPGGDPELGYSIDAGNHASVQWYLHQLLTGYIMEDEVDWYTTSDAAQAFFEPFNVFQSHLTNQTWPLPNSLQGSNQTGVEHIITNLATSMTNYMRNNDNYITTGSGSRPYLANGTILEQVTVVHVRWPWIAAHVSFTVFTLLFLAATVLYQRFSPLREQYPWKTSESATLRALDPNVQVGLHGITSTSQMHEGNSGQYVKLVRSEDSGWRLYSKDLSGTEMTSGSERD